MPSIRRRESWLDAPQPQFSMNIKQRGKTRCQEWIFPFFKEGYSLTDNGPEYETLGDAAVVMATFPELKLWSVWLFGGG